MKLFTSGLIVTLAIINLFGSVYDHNLQLAGAWGSALIGWLIVLAKEMVEE